MIHTVTDEVNNETFYFGTKRRQWVEPEEDDNFELEDESE